MNLRDIVIVGASAAGSTAALTLRREGFDGTITVIGAEDRMPYDRPPLSKAVRSQPRRRRELGSLECDSLLDLLPERDTIHHEDPILPIVHP